MLQIAHDHPVGLDDGLDFINTLAHSDDHDEEHLPTAEAAIEWFAERGLVHRGDAEREQAAVRTDPARAAATIERIRRARGALREVYDAVAQARPADAEAVAEVNTLLSCCDVVQLEVAPDGIRIGHRHVREPIEQALAGLTTPVVDELASAERDRLRVCANDSCRWVFRDASPSGRRRWCSMASCGNRAKAARHRARAKAGA